MRPLDPRLLRRSAAVRRYLVVGVALGTATAGLLVVQAWLIAEVIARAFEGAVLAGATALVAGLALVLAGRATIGWLHQVVAQRAAAGVKTQLRSEIAGSLVDPRRGGPPPDPGRTATLLGTGLDALDPYVARYLPQLALAVTVPATVVAAMAAADLLAAATVAITLPLIPVFMALVGWLTAERTARRWAALQRLGRQFADILAGLVVLKGFGRDQREGLRRAGEENRRATLGALRLAFLSTFVLELLATICVALVAVGVGLRIVEGRLDLATGLFVLLLAPEAFAPVRQVGSQFHASAEGVAAAQEAFELLDRPVRAPGGRRPRLREAIEVLDVEVRYPDRTEAALGPVSFRVPAEGVTALVGPSGCGKSTALAVIGGLRRPTAGRVLIDGADLADVDIEAWHRRIAWVPQRPGIVAGSIEDNLRFGDPRLDREQLRRVLDDVGARSLDLDRLVAEGGRDLSAGERRRVGVARALSRVRAGGVDLLLLDEPTAGLDVDTETAVVRAVRDSGTTVALVTHRGPALALADRVIELAGSGPAEIRR